MKVKCERCGHQFVYEKQDGVCDKCNYYMSKPVPVMKSKMATLEPSQQRSSREPVMRTQEDVQRQMQGKQTQKQMRTRTNEQIQKKTKVPWKFTTVQKISCAIIFFCMILVPCIVVPKTQEMVKQREELKEVGQIAPQIFQMNQDISIGASTLRIIACEEMTQWQTKAPEGSKLLLVSYENEESSQDNLCYDAEVYFKLPTNEYIEPLSEYRLAEEVGVDRETLVERYGVSDEIQEEVGSFLFLVPDSIEQGTLAVYYIPEIGDTDALDSVNEIKMDWRADR